MNPEECTRTSKEKKEEEPVFAGAEKKMEEI